MKNVKMLLANGFAPDIRVYKEAKYLNEQGCNVEIMCIDLKNDYKDKPEEIYNGIKIKRFYPRTEKTTEKINNNKIIGKLKYSGDIAEHLAKIENEKSRIKTFNYIAKQFKGNN